MTPIGDRAADYMATTVTKTGANVTNINLSISVSIPKAIVATVTAPAGSTVSMGVFGDYYSYEFVEEDSAKIEGDTLTASFRLPTTTKNHFLRVQHPDGVTYWTFGKWTTEQNFAVTKEDLHIGDKEFTKDTVYRFEKNKYDRADIYLNINSKGYMNMDVGQTFELNVFRNWMALENTVSNAQVALPDMHYQVVDLQGRPSDVVTITPDKNNNSLSTLKANKEGTAIVLVTYDAMTHMQGLSSTDSKEFPRFGRNAPVYSSYLWVRTAPPFKRICSWIVWESPYLSRNRKTSMPNTTFYSIWVMKERSIPLRRRADAQLPWPVHRGRLCNVL